MDNLSSSHGQRGAPAAGADTRANARTHTHALRHFCFTAIHVIATNLPLAVRLDTSIAIRPSGRIDRLHHE
jgi:hypothetical protein